MSSRKKKERKKVEFLFQSVKAGVRKNYIKTIGMTDVNPTEKMLGHLII